MTETDYDQRIDEATEIRDLDLEARAHVAAMTLEEVRSYTARLAGYASYGAMETAIAAAENEEDRR